MMFLLVVAVFIRGWRLFEEGVYSNNYGTHLSEVVQGTGELANEGCIVTKKHQLFNNSI